MREWLAGFRGEPRASLDLVRVLVAAVIITHPLYDLAHPAIVSELGRVTQPALGPAVGVVLAWTGVLVQVVASLAVLVRRWIVPSCTALIVVWGAAALIFQWPAWYVVGGLEVTGHPGAEFSVLVIACLAGVLAWHRQGASEVGARCGLDIVRFTVALNILLHGGYGLLSLDLTGMRAFGAQLEQAGLPFGVALVWLVVVIEAVGSCALLARRLVVPACIGQIFVLANGIWSTHAPYWFVIGPGRSFGRGWSRAAGSDEGGMEYSVLLIACLTAVLLAHWPRRTAPARELETVGGSDASGPLRDPRA